MSDLRSNATRGVLAEYLVAKAVGATGPRIEWDAYDVRAPDGTTIEVKASGYSQSWTLRSAPSIRFGGLPGKPGKQSWHAETGAMETAFVADVFVFAVHTTLAADPYDGLDVDAWQFYVLPGSTIAATRQASMQLSTVIRLGGVPVGWQDLRSAIAAARSSTGVSDGPHALPPTEVRCRHDMLPGTCSDCEPRRPARASRAVVEISPSRIGHLPGCSHKDDEDWSRWGRVLRPGAWQELRNGNAVTADDPEMIVGLTATVACRDCVARS